MAYFRNTALADFDAGSASDDAENYRIYSDATGTSTLLISKEVSNASELSALTANQYYRIAANALTLTLEIGTGGATEEGVTRGLNGLIRGGLHVQLYNAFGDTDVAPSDAAALTNRIEIAESGWTKNTGSPT